MKMIEMNDYLTEINEDEFNEENNIETLVDSFIFSTLEEFNKYVDNINAIFNFKQYKALENLLKDYTIEDYDIIKDIALNNKGHHKIKEIKKKLHIIENYYVIPLINRQTGKKTVACPYPDINVNLFYLHEDIVLIDVNTIETILNKKILKNY